MNFNIKPIVFNKPTPGYPYEYRIEFGPINLTRMEQILDWCTQNEIGCSYIADSATLYMRGKDAILFSLRWS
jgi:hypothetical protein